MRAPSQDLRVIPSAAAPQSRVVSLVLVALLHVAVVYALATGLAQQMVQMLPQNINVNIIPQEELKHEPPPPPPPQFKQPPPFVPPPDVTIDLSTAPAATSAITAQSSQKDITAAASIGRPHTCDARRYYPPQGITNNWTGTTVVSFVITADGSVRNVQIRQSSGHPELDTAAIRCSSTWQYRPALLHGQPVDQPNVVNIKWTLKG